ncbi:MAG: hypothetical protein A3F80_08165 [Candidatus Melainabacteria bacterium RIFCSPLOWO2_12_FULL_35_11]|nr:MAG: hypothetical protein A3F80_08165 [Candidatus Melainabacteria bacterium RIFCSPLOWO2_12_FULL_35_11]
MIKVLKTWDEIGKSIIHLQELGIPIHHQPQKNWDLYNMLKVIEENIEKSEAILDIGASGCPVLEALFNRGYSNLYGIDLNFGFREKFNRTILAALHRRDFGFFFGFSPINLKNANLCKTDFPKEKFMAITSLSVVEHGIFWDDYFKEMSRLLKPGGYLLTSTDFWHEKINTNGIFICGAPMKIFIPKDITEGLSIAYKYGFREISESIPNTKQKCVTCNDIQYTFLLFVLQKI